MVVVMNNCGIWSAPTSGFDITVIDPEAAGWNKVAGITDLVQDASTRIVLDNGLTRVSLDKNRSQDTDSIIMAAWNGTSFKVILRGEGSTSNDVNNPTVTSITSNEPRIVSISFSFTPRDLTTTLTADLTLLEGVPMVHYKKTSGTNTAIGGLALETGLGANTALINTASPTAVDIYGYNANSINLTSSNGLLVIPLPLGNLDLIIQSSNDPGTDVYLLSNRIMYTMENKTHIYFGFAVRMYTFGDSGRLGNSNGQFREAEDNWVNVTGTWVSNSSIPSTTSGGKCLSNTNTANTHEVKWLMHFPAPGKYYVATSACANAAVSFDVGVNGVLSGAPQTFTSAGGDGSGAFATMTSQNTFGPFTVASAGGYPINLKVLGGSSFTVHVDFIDIFPYEATSATNNTNIMPKTLGNALLKQVTPNGVGV